MVSDYTILIITTITIIKEVKIMNNPNCAIGNIELLHSGTIIDASGKKHEVPLYRVRANHVLSGEEMLINDVYFKLADGISLSDTAYVLDVKTEDGELQGQMVLVAYTIQE